MRGLQITHAAALLLSVLSSSRYSRFCFRLFFGEIQLHILSSSEKKGKIPIYQLFVASLLRLLDTWTHTHTPYLTFTILFVAATHNPANSSS